MKQLRFLGRTAQASSRSNVLRSWPTWRALIEDSGVGGELATSHLAALGFDAEEIQALRSDPHATVARLRAQEQGCAELFRELEAQRAHPGLVRSVRAFADAIADVPELLQLDRCERDDGGRFAISYHLPSHQGAVSEGDLLFAGVTLAADARDGTVAVAPRVVRQVCNNGMVQATDLAGQQRVYRANADGTCEGTLEAAVEAGLSREVVTAVADQLRPLTAIRVTEPVRALAERGVEIPPEAATGVRAAFEANQDRTVYGAFNALTQTARDTRDVGRRIDLEASAGHLVAVLARIEQTTPDGVEIA